LTRPPPRPTLFPYTTLFRSREGRPLPGEPGRPPSLEETRVIVKNGNGEEGCAATVAQRLQHLGVEVTDIGGAGRADVVVTQVRRSEEHTSELQSRGHLVCRL